MFISERFSSCSVHLLFYQHPADSEKCQYPGWGYPHAIPDTVGLVDAPASQHDVPHSLHGLGVGKYPGHRHHPLPRHPLQRPDDATEQHVGEAGTDGKFDSVHRTVADGGEKKSKTHARQALRGKYVSQNILLEELELTLEQSEYNEPCNWAVTGNLKYDKHCYQCYCCLN